MMDAIVDRIDRTNEFFEFLQTYYSPINFICRRANRQEGIVTFRKTKIEDSVIHEDIQIQYSCKLYKMKQWADTELNIAFTNIMMELNFRHNPRQLVLINKIIQPVIITAPTTCTICPRFLIMQWYKTIEKNNYIIIGE